MSPPNDLTSSSPPPSSPSISHLRILILEPSPLPSPPPFIKPLFPSSLTQSQLQPQPPSPSLIPPLLYALTGDLPTIPTLPNHAGSNGSSDVKTERISYAGYTSHPPIRITTRYFNKKFGLWCDEVPLPSPLPRRGAATPGSGDGESVGTVREERKGDDFAVMSKEEEKEGEGQAAEESATTQIWLTQMLSPAPEAVEVRSVIGAIVLALPVRDAIIQDASILATNLSPFAPLDDDDDDGMHLCQPRQTSCHWKVRDEYLDVIEAVDTLRSTIEDERVKSGAEGDVGAVVVLQREMSGTSSGRSTSTTKGTGTAKVSRKSRDDDSEVDDSDGDSDGNPADALVEAVEEQLLTDRAILGWDVIAWDGVPPTISENLTAGVEGREKGSIQLDPQHGASVRDPQEEQRNLYGEKTGLARLNEILQNVDWSATPSPSPSQRRRNHPQSENAEDDEEEEDRDIHLDLDLDPDFLLSPSSTHDRTTRTAAKASTRRKQHNHEDDDDEAFVDENEDQEEEGAAATAAAPSEAAQVEQLQSLLQQAMLMREMGIEAVPRSEKERFARRLLDL